MDEHQVPDGLTDHRLTRPGGRTVAYTTWGEPDGRPILRIPGTPGSRFSVRADTTPWRDRNLRMITTERPGFGASTPLPGRGFSEHSDDLAAILDDVGVERVHVFGGSGAAPHILSFCSLHADRVVAATIVSGAAPLDDHEEDQLIELNAAGRRLHKAGDVEGGRALLTQVRDAIMENPLAAMRSVMESAPPGDQEVLADPAFQQALRTATLESLRQGIDGWYDEGFAIEESYDEIDLDAIQCTIAWFHTRDDRNTPLSAAERLVAKLPTARLEIWDDGGHLAAYHREGGLLDELISRS